MIKTTLGLVLLNIFYCSAYGMDQDTQYRRLKIFLFDNPNVLYLNYIKKELANGHYNPIVLTKLLDEYLKRPITSTVAAARSCWWQRLPTEYLSDLDDIEFRKYAIQKCLKSGNLSQEKKDNQQCIDLACIKQFSHIALTASEWAIERISMSHNMIRNFKKPRFKVPTNAIDHCNNIRSQIVRALITSGADINALTTVMYEDRSHKVPLFFISLQCNDICMGTILSKCKEVRLTAINTVEIADNLMSQWPKERKWPWLYLLARLHYNRFLHQKVITHASRVICEEKDLKNSYAHALHKIKTD